MKHSTIVFGLARSGASWLARCIAYAGHFRYIHEPDNECISFHAYLAKQGMHRFPFLQPDDEAEAYKEIFSNALEGQMMSPRSAANRFLFRASRLGSSGIKKSLKQNQGVNQNDKFIAGKYLLPFAYRNIKASGSNRLIKSSHAILSSAFLLEQLTFYPIFVVRDPFDLLASYKRRQSSDFPMQIGKQKGLAELLNEQEVQWEENKSQIGLIAQELAIYYWYIDQITEKYRSDLILFEDLKSKPVEVIESLYQRMGLVWSRRIEGKIREHHRKHFSGSSSSDIIEEIKTPFSEAERSDIENAFESLPNTIYPISNSVEY